MPRHAGNSRLLARPSETRLEINKRFAGLEIVENEFILSAQRPSLQDSSSIRVNRNDPRLLRLRRENIQNVLFEVHVGPTKDENLPGPQTRIQANRIKS